MRNLSCLLLLAICIGCSDPKSVVVTAEVKDDILQAIKDQKGLTPDEVRMVLAYQMRQGAVKAFGGSTDDPTGKTIGELIEAQRKFEADAAAKQKETDRLAAEAKAKEEALAAELSKSIQFTVFAKDFVPSNAYAGRYQDYITVKCAYENRSSKDIRAFRGRVEFNDLFGKLVYATSVTISDPVKAGAKATWIGSIDYNQFDEDDQALRNAELANLKVRWLPKGVIFADGTTLGESGS